MPKTPSTLTPMAKPNPEDFNHMNATITNNNAKTTTNSNTNTNNKTLKMGEILKTPSPPTDRNWPMETYKRHGEMEMVQRATA